jgi:putative addiction module antidote
MKLKITAIGDSAGIVLPKELLARMRLAVGDELCALEAPEGIKLVRYDAEFARQMDVAEEVMQKERNLLRKLADSGSHNARRRAPPL